MFCINGVDPENSKKIVLVCENCGAKKSLYAHYVREEKEVGPCWNCSSAPLSSDCLRAIRFLKEGKTVRKAAKLAGLSHQRVYQLLAMKQVQEMNIVIANELVKYKPGVVINGRMIIKRLNCSRFLFRCEKGHDARIDVDSAQNYGCLECRTAEIVGKEINDWTVLRRVRGKGWLCRCKCGTEKFCQLANVTSGRSRGCNQCMTTRERS